MHHSVENVGQWTSVYFTAPVTNGALTHWRHENDGNKYLLWSTSDGVWLKVIATEQTYFISWSQVRYAECAPGHAPSPNVRRAPAPAPAEKKQ